ncbi:uncharacterized protein LOC120291632 [Eucalyptus grandis]|uniref:uncharacterized protein LOC120291632 n=1 Tax=Eucalyptus grandis TaxID=71139 RepID=UPI00192F0465|nr:uncharacterized protein LOC120291632 [Eucalyptus grandis]
MKEADDIYVHYLKEPNPQTGGMVDFLCKNATDACDSEPPPLPKDRTPGEAFMPKPSEEADVERKAKSSTESTPGAPRTNTYLMDESTNTKNSGEEDKDKGTHSHSKLVRGSSKEAPLPSETRKTEL